MFIINIWNKLSLTRHWYLIINNGCLTTSLLNFWKFDLDPRELVCTNWTNSTLSPISPSPSRPMAPCAQPTVLYDCFSCESRTRSLASSPKHLARVCHPVGVSVWRISTQGYRLRWPYLSTLVSSIGRSAGRKVTQERKKAQISLWSRRVSVHRGRVSGHVRGSSAGHSALRPSLATTL